MRLPQGPRAFTVADLFSLQVKGQQDLLYGRVRKGKWNSHEIQWLRTLAVPLYLVQVEPTLNAINLYSLGRLWRVLWQDQPFQIKCVTRPPSDESVQPPIHTKEPVAGSREKYGSEHSGNRWAVDLGPPFLRLSNSDLNDPEFKRGAIECLLRWLHYDRRTLIRFQLRVAIVDHVQRWSTNEFNSQHVFERAMYWNSAPGMNIADLAQPAAEVLMNLGVNLQWQNNRDAYRLIEALEYLNDIDALDAMGQGLLKGLKETRDQGRGPREPESDGQVAG